MSDSEYCGQCNKYLFTDMPGYEDETDLIMCQTCSKWYCEPCSNKLGISYNKLSTGEFDKFYGKYDRITHFPSYELWDFSVDCCPKCLQEML